PPVCSYLLSAHASSPTATYPLSLHDALPIFLRRLRPGSRDQRRLLRRNPAPGGPPGIRHCRCQRQGSAGGNPDGQPSSDAAHFRSEEHTSELQSRVELVCRLLLEKKKYSPRR